MTLIDSSCWIAYFIDDRRARLFVKYLRNPADLVVPSLVIYEVYRHLHRKIGEQEALFLVTQLQEATVVPLDEDLALDAAELSLKYKLGTADAVIYATARAHEAKLLTLDNDFRDLPGCVVVD